MKNIKKYIYFSFFVVTLFAVQCFVSANDAAESFIEYPRYGSDDWEQSPTGNHKILVIPVLFSDVKNSTNIGDLNNIMENLSKYYYNVSYGKLNLTYTIEDWVALNKTMSYYGADGGFEDKSSLRIDALNNLYYQIGIDVVKTADKDVNFSGYDHLIIIHAGDNQADNQSCRDCIWSISMPSLEVETNDWHYWQGEELYPAAVNYGIILSETDSFSAYAHEFGHELGLPDLYDVENGSSVVGFYDLMDDGAWISSHLGAWTKLKLRFVDEIIIYNETRNLTIYPAERNDSVVKIIRGNPSSWQYYLVELRKKEGYDAQLPYEGVLVWKIDESFMDNQKSKHTPIVDLFLFNESKNFIDEEGGIFINITLNSENTTLSILSVPTDLNITNRVLTGELVKPTTCKWLDIYNKIWPENNPQYITFPENETDYFTINDNEVIIWAKVNANIGDNITFEFIKNINNNSNNFEYYKSITFKFTKNISRNTYNHWNWYIDPVHASLPIDTSMVGEWFVRLWINGIFYYLNNFTITNKSDTKPPEVNLFSLPQNITSDKFSVQWNAQDTGENASGLKNYIIYYYDNDSAFFGGGILNYTTNKTNATFYGKAGHTYCFWVTAIDRAKNRNSSEIECRALAANKQVANLTAGNYSFADTGASTEEAGGSKNILQENKVYKLLVVCAAVIILIIFLYGKLYRKRK